MKNLKFITTILLMSFIGLTSCQKPIDIKNGQNPNTNSADSQTASNLERSSMYDGSFDDFLDGISCSSILLPVVATVNGIQVTILTESDYQLVLNILGQFNTDNDSVTLQFPLTVKMSNYTEAIITNQLEYDALIDACYAAETNGNSAISCINIDFPITILTYSLSLDQTGSVVIESEQQLYTYMNNLGNNELFSVSYPITATLNNTTVITITSDLELQSSIIDCLGVEDAKNEAKNQANILETILVDGTFKVQSFINGSVETANAYADYTIDFASDLSCSAQNIINSGLNEAQGTYEVTSQTEVYINLNFSGNATFVLLNNSWKVTSYTQSLISLQSTINAGITLVLAQI